MPAVPLSPSLLLPFFAVFLKKAKGDSGTAGTEKPLQDPSPRGDGNGTAGTKRTLHDHSPRNDDRGDMPTRKKQLLVILIVILILI